METRRHSSAMCDEALEVSQELRRLVPHDLSVLDWHAAQDIVQLSSLVGCRPCFILRGLFAEPEMKIVRQGILIRALLVGLHSVGLERRAR